MSWFRRPFSISVGKAANEKPTFLYREGKRKMQISGETIADGYAIYSASIKEWDGRPEDVVDETDRQRIASNVQQYFTGKGKTVYLS